MSFTELKSDINSKKFDISLSEDKKIIYKKVNNNEDGQKLIKDLQDDNNYEQYKKIITTIKDDPYIGIHTIKGFDVEKNGSYKCNNINGYRFDKILKDDIKFDNVLILDKIITQINKLKKNINENYTKVGGDWDLYNIFYDVVNDNIVNINIEGFYTNTKLKNWGSIDKVNNLLDSVQNKIETYKNILNNRNNLEVKLVLPFLKSFFKNNNLDFKLNQSLIGTTFNEVSSNIYVATEAHDKKVKDVDLYIKVASNNIVSLKKKNSYHVTWGAISFYLRNCSYNTLLKPLKNIYNRKRKFCSYMFRNKSYKNAARRYKFYQILNFRKRVDNIKTKKRYLTEMYNNAVEEYRPFRFSIAFENDIINGYITEKIINSFLAGCIPIYDGPSDIFKYFNKDSFIYARNFKSLVNLANYVIYVYNNPWLMNKYLNTPPSTKEKLQKLFWWENIK